MVRAKLEVEKCSLSHDYRLYPIVPDMHQTYSGNVGDGGGLRLVFK